MRQILAMHVVDCSKYLFCQRFEHGFGQTPNRRDQILKAPVCREVLYHGNVRFRTVPKRSVDARELIRNAHGLPLVYPLLENLSRLPVSEGDLLHAEYFKGGRVQHLLDGAGRGFENGQGDHLVESHRFYGILTVAAHAEAKVIECAEARRL